MGLTEKADYLYRQAKEKETHEKQHEEDKKNSNFVQVYREQMNNIATLAAQNITAMRVLLFLIEHMDGTNALAVSNVALKELLGISIPTVSRSIKHLKDNGWICILKTGNSNVYIVNPDVAWTSYGYQKQYCKFNATVLLTPSENADYLQNRNAFTKFKHLDSDFVKAVQENKAKFNAFAEMIETEEEFE